MDADERLVRAFLEAHPQDGARVLESFAPEEVAARLDGLPAAVVAGVARRMMPARSAACLSVMPVDRAAAAVAELPPDVGAAILRRMPAESAEALRAELPTRTRESLERLLRYEENTVGALVDPFAFTLPDDITVGEALKRVRRDARRVRYYLYVVDRDRRLVGVLNLRDFLLAPPEAPMAAIMRTGVVTLHGSMRIDQAALSPLWRRYLALPVVDAQGTFLGVLEASALSRGDEHRHAGRTASLSAESVLAASELYWKGMTTVLERLFPQPPENPPSARSSAADGGEPRGHRSE